MCTTIWNDVYLHAKAQKVFWSYKKKFTKDEVIPNHGEQNRVLDMANLEIHFLTNNKCFFLQTSMNTCGMSHPPTSICLIWTLCKNGDGMVVWMEPIQLCTQFWVSLYMCA